MRIEAIKAEVQNIPSGITGGVSYRSQVQRLGWQNWVDNYTISGTTGLRLRDEGIQLSLTGGISNYFTITYHAHVQTIGWQNWVPAGYTAGSIGKSLRMEAIEIKIIPK